MERERQSLKRERERTEELMAKVDELRARQRTGVLADFNMPPAGNVPFDE